MDIKPLLIVFGCMLTLVTPLYFEDCGTHGFKINSVQIEGCWITPCRIPVGESRKITVNSVNTVTNFSTLHSRAYIIYLGIAWELDVTPTDICQHWGGCPLSETATRSYSGDVFFNSTLLRRASYLMISARYETANQNDPAFCIRLQVNLV